MNDNEIQMVNISSKEITKCEAIAEGLISMQPETVEMVRESTLPKGNAQETARGDYGREEYSADYSAVPSTVGFSRFNNS